MEDEFKTLQKAFGGDLCLDELTRIAYSTDASIYREMPAAVAFPRNEADLVLLVEFAARNGLSLIPRTAGTSLAGQVVGPGIVADVSRYMTRILEINEKEKYAWVEPGVVLDELNLELSRYGLYFGPETSTGNRCMIGGMVGNNACGLRSLVYGSTRDHTLAIRTVLSDGSIAVFEAVTGDEFSKMCSGNSLENSIYRTVSLILARKENRESIRTGFPDPAVPRRNTGYALDMLIDTDPFLNNGIPLNLCRILAGSEGTLAFFSAIKINLVNKPPARKALVCAHFNSLHESLKANLVALEHGPTAVELMDSVVLECTKSNIGQRANRFFLVGDPGILLIIEMVSDKQEELDKRVQAMIEDLASRNLGYAYPVVEGDDIRKVWELRKAGLGLLANIPGDSKTVTVIEDIAVPVGRLHEFIGDMEVLFDRFGISCVYHAHVGTGELHLRPSLNLKDPADIGRFKAIAADTVDIVRKYRGSLSGEHGDGRLRSNFIPQLLGEKNYQFIRQIKHAFDPRGILNPGKIVDAPPMDSHLRTLPGVPTPEIPAIYDFSDTLGYVRAVEKCNGSGDCRKSHLMGGTMCPSYQATRDEKNTTRARANVLREFIYREPGRNHLDHPEIREILDLCLSCKACKSECPSGVDMAKLKSEFLYHWHEVHPMPLRDKLIANMPALYRTGYPFRGLLNLLFRNRATGSLVKKLAGIAPQRSIPSYPDLSTSAWASRNLLKINPSHTVSKGKVFVFIDEFTDFQDATVGIKSIRLLASLGYSIIIRNLATSARTYISKGMLIKARMVARKNVLHLREVITPESPLVGLEPSAILGFRDEYPDLAGDDLKQDCLKVAANSLMLEEFLAREIRAGKISRNQFTTETRQILLHGHCQQKAVASTKETLFVLSFPENYTCREIPSGCCGMAGAFGYEKEHFELSMKVGELVLFPTVREASPDTLICATGTSCRHHILDGTGKKALHPAEILFDALSGND